MKTTAELKNTWWYRLVKVFFIIFLPWHFKYHIKVFELVVFKV